MIADAKDNLFDNLSHWAIRQNENFTTEALVYLLNNLISDEPKVACNLLMNLTDGFLKLNKNQIKQLTIRTQTVVEESRPDIELQIDEYLIYIEVKIDSELGKDQLTRYRKILNNSGAKLTQLIFLSRYPLTGEKDGKPDVAVRWYQIADWLIEELKNNNVNEISLFLMKQFCGYLKAQNMTLSKVKSAVSEGLNSYRERFGDVAQKLKRVRSFEIYDQDKDLKPLANLLRLMREALISIKIKPRLESGQNKGGWAGFVFNEIDYCFFIPYAQPENIVFETVNLDINPDKFDGELGNLWQEGKKVRWKTELNLAEINFFSKDKKSQLNIIEEFLKQSYKYSKLIMNKKQ
jgi:hypothetical protein